MATARTVQTASSWLGAFLFLGAVPWLQGCSHEAEQKLKEGVVGSWAEVGGTNATLQFNADGTLIGLRTRGNAPRPYVWNISVTADDKLLIGDAQQVGTYQRQ